MMDAEELGILDEFREHGTAVKAERARAAAAGEAPNFIDMIRGWGGVTLAYRKRLQDAPAYRLNHEEVALALQEGISVTENMNPVEAIPDEFGHVKAMAFTRADGSRVELPARTVLVAAGTVPNVTYEKEHPGSFSLDSKQKFFKGFKASSKTATANSRSNRIPNGFFTSHDTDGKFVTYYGDNHPRYNGNVVKAMASAKHGYPHVVELFADDIAALDPKQQPQREARVAVAGDEARRRAARARRTGRAPDADDRRSDRARARGGAAFPSRPVLSPAEFRAPQPARARRRSRRVDADGRHRADRRVGRSREGPAVADHARDGRVEPAVRVSRSRASPSS